MYVKRVMKTGGFIIGLAVLLLLASYVFLPKDNTQSAGIEDEFANGFLGEERNTIDVAVMGDSYSYTAIVPLEMWRSDGYTVYACGTNEETLDYTMILLRRLFSCQSPKVVVLETNPIYHPITRFNELLERLEEYFPVFLYHDRWKKTLRPGDLYKKPDYTLTKKYKGCRYFTKIKPLNEKDESRWEKTDEEESIPSLSLDYMRRIKDFCDRHGARLVLMTAPNEMYWNSRRHNGIQHLSEKIGCDYIDMNYENDAIGIDWSHDTVDYGDHLNHAGAVKATAYLAKYLSSLGILTDHRSDEAYERWEKCCRNYENRAAREPI